MTDTRTGILLCDGIEIGRIEVTGGEMLAIWGSFVEAEGFDVCRSLLADMFDLREKLAEGAPDDDSVSKWEQDAEQLARELGAHRFEYRPDGGTPAPAEQVQWEPGWIEFRFLP